MADAIDELVARSQDCKEVRRFHNFHRSHPEVLDFLLEEIRLRFDRGFATFSYHTLWEYARWKLEMEMGPGDTLLMNDRDASLYACAIAILHPEFDGLAEFNHARAYAALRTQIGAATEETSAELSGELWVAGRWYNLANWLAAHKTVHSGPSPVRGTAEPDSLSLSLLPA